MTTAAQLKSASDRHVAQRTSLIEQLIRLLLGLWGGFSRWDDADVVAGMAARSATLAENAVAQARQGQRTYLRSLLEADGIDTRAMPDLFDGYPRANVTPSEVYRRPVEQFIWNRRLGLSGTAPLEAFEERLRAIAEADVMTAQRDEAQAIFDAFTVVLSWRRVIHPEKAKSKASCGLCIVAATQVYRTRDLLPLHGGCNCDVAPITKDSDPGKALNDLDLQELYSAAGGTEGELLKFVRVQVKENGELGPVLIKVGDHFRTPEEVGRPKYAKPTTESIRALRVQERADLTQALDSAQARYDQFVADNPDSLIPNDSRGGERVALFTAIRQLRERVTLIDRYLARS